MMMTMTVTLHNEHFINMGCMAHVAGVLLTMGWVQCPPYFSQKSSNSLRMVVECEIIQGGEMNFTTLYLGPKDKMK